MADAGELFFLPSMRMEPICNLNSAADLIFNRSLDGNDESDDGRTVVDDDATVGTSLLSLSSSSPTKMSSSASSLSAFEVFVVAVFVVLSRRLPSPDYTSLPFAKRQVGSSAVAVRMTWSIA